MATTSPTDLRGAQGRANRARLASVLQQQGALVALALLLLFGGLRYDGFLSAYNMAEALRYNAMFGLIALGMTFVIMTGGIDLSVGSLVALASVVTALLSPYGLLPALVGPVLVGTLAGLISGTVIARLGIAPFITTLALMLAARGLALMLAPSSVVVAAESGVTVIGQNNLGWLPLPAVVLAAAYLVGSVVLNRTRFGRHVLAVGGGEEAARLMGLPTGRIKVAVYALSGGLAGLAGVLLAAQTGTGVPTVAVGWELQAIAAVVVGGTLLTGGRGSVGTTLVGVLLLGLIINVLSFEGLSPYWQSVIRGGFLLIVVMLQNQLTRRDRTS